MLVSALTLSPDNLLHGFYFHGASIHVSIAIIDDRISTYARKLIHMALDKKKIIGKSKLDFNNCKIAK